MSAPILARYGPHTVDTLVPPRSWGRHSAGSLRAPGEPFEGEVATRPRLAASSAATVTRLGGSSATVARLRGTVETEPS